MHIHDWLNDHFDWIFWIVICGLIVFASGVGIYHRYLEWKAPRDAERWMKERSPKK